MTAKAANVSLVPTLREAVRMEVLSLDPNDHEESDSGVHRFQGYRVFGRILVPTGEQFMKLRDSLITGIIPPANLLCFSPRHGIRIKSKKRTIDLVICFECGQAGAVGLPNQKPPLQFSIASSVAKDLLNSILDEAKIKRDIPKQRD